MTKSFFDKVMPRIMFDTNTYRHIIDGTADNSNVKEVYIELHNLIKNNMIEAFLSETIFTVEAIVKKDRLAFMSQYNPEIHTKTSLKVNSINMTITLGPDTKHKVNFEGTEPLGDYFKKAIALGFKVIRMPRIGGILNAEISDDMRFRITDSDDFNRFNNKAGEVGRRIENNGAGAAHIQQTLSAYNKNNNIFTQFDLLFQDVNKMPVEQRKTEINKVAKAIAELSDGDSVAASIGLDCDAFCTNDRAVNAGEKSVFSEENVNWLKEQYTFNKLTPTELIEFLHSMGVAAKSETIE